jgi:ATP-dependent helicase/nuclease subunit B
MRDPAAEGVKRAHTRRLFVSGSYAGLETAAVELLRALHAAGDPLQPLWVVVPTNLLRRHLARRVASGTSGHANLRFLTLLDLARELAETSLLEGGWTFLSDLAATALLRRLVTEQPSDYFAPLADRPGFHASLLATFNDLADGEVDARTLRDFVDAIPPDSAGAARLAALTQLYRSYRSQLATMRLYDRNDLLIAAASRAATMPPPGGQLVVYGFYDLTPLQRRLLAAVTGNASTVAFVPWEEESRFAYAAHTVAWLRSLGFDLATALPTAPAVSDLTRAQAYVFDHPPTATGVQPDGSLRVISAPGEAREAREVARTVLALAQEPGLAFHEIAVLLRTSEPYAALITDTLSRCGIPVYREGGRPLTETRAGRALLLLLRVAQEGFARTAVIEFLTVAPVPFAALIDDGARCHPAQWDVFSAEAGIVAGRAEWTSRLTALQRRYRSQQQRDEEPPPGLAARLEELGRCRRFIDRFGTDIDGLSRHTSWRTMVGAVLDLFGRYALPGEGTEPIHDALAPLAQLDATAGDASLNDFVAAAMRALELAREPVGAFGRGVFVGEIMAARGLSFRATIIPGLVERGIPRPVREDPLLLDDERAYLGERTGRLVSEKKSGFDEERLLFTLMLRSATKIAILSFPRLDMTTGRDRLPSFYLLHVFTAVSGRRASYREFDRWNRVRRVELSRLFPAVAAQAVDRTERYLAGADAAMQGEEAAPLAALFATAPFFRRACNAEIARSGVAFTPYDGVLIGGRARARLAEREWALSVRRVQTYLRCPYRFFLEQVLAIEQVEEPERVRSVSPLDRGTLVHGVLCEFYRRATAAGIVPLQRQHELRAKQLMGEVVTAQCAEFTAEGLTGLPLVWEREQRLLTEKMLDFVAAEIAASDGFVPTRFEYGFGDGDATVALRLPDGEVVRLRGRIDRIDWGWSNDGRVIDYKTGRPTEVAPDVIDADTIQLPFYLHAARVLFPERQWQRADLYYVGPHSHFERRGYNANAPAAQEAALAEFLAPVVRGIHSGWFAAGAPSCVRCQFVAICGRANVWYGAKHAPGQAA